MRLNHFDDTGSAIMADISQKEQTQRLAIAEGIITMNKEAYEAAKSGTAKKGDVLGVARIAGIMAAKNTSSIIPLCHSIQITSAALDFSTADERREIKALCTVASTGRTGVEMEALTGVSAALLTVYDMLKARDRGMRITNIRLIKKTGGKSGEFSVGEE